MTADVQDLLGHLAEYMDRVRGGETVFITDQEHVIAKLEPATEADILEDEEAWIADLVRRGIATAPRERMSAADNEKLLAQLSNQPPLPDIVAAVTLEREEGW